MARRSYQDECSYWDDHWSEFGRSDSVRESRPERSVEQIFADVRAERSPQDRIMQDKFEIALRKMGLL